MPIRLGPLTFPAPLAPLTESLGDGLEAVGAALVAAERRARPFTLELAVHGNPADPDERETGMRLRRQARQLLDNARWRLQGLYFHWPADPELSGWLVIGGGDLEESDPGVSFGDFTLKLTDCYMRGRPGTHRPGRRLDIADRRGGLVPLDTRGTLYTAEWAAISLPTKPLTLPGDVIGLTTSLGAAPSNTPAAAISGRRPFTRAAGADGTVITYRPNLAVLPGDVGAAAMLELDAAGDVRAYDQRAGFTGGATAGQIAATPEAVGWERVYGPVIDYRRPLAMDNGICRLTFNVDTEGAGGGVIVAFRSGGVYVNAGRIVGPNPAPAGLEATVLELTPERGVLEWRNGPSVLRVILQRGWPGPRIESFDTEPIRWFAAAGTAASSDLDAMVSEFAPSPAGPPAIYYAKGRSTDVIDVRAGAVNISPATGQTLVAQIAPVGAELDAAGIAALAVADVRSEPILLARTT